jgi:hypothetical protein
MGRNSVEATKASLIRAVRARRAALLACGWCLRGLLAADLPEWLAVWTAGFAPVLVVEVAGLLVALLVLLAASVVALAGVFLFCFGLTGVLCALAEAEPAGAASCLPADRAAAGSAVVNRESRTTMQPEASREIGVGEEMTLISLL